MATSFRVIIVGGGPIGLLAAHMLSKAGLDFVLFERRDTLVPDSGASVGVYSQTFRVFDQLGLLKAIQEIWNPLQRKLVITHKGVLYKNHPRFSWMRENHGHPFAMLHRADLLAVLYENLPAADKLRVHTEKHVTGIEIHGNGVNVLCSDGTVESGSIVIGADGVYSKVRQHMRELAGLSNPQPSLNENHPFTASFRLLYGSAPNPRVEPESSWEAHGANMSTQLFVGRDKVWFFWYERLETPTKDRIIYSKDDEARFVEKWGHVCITDKVLLKDLYASRLSSGMTILEEGIEELWSRNRIVLVGDAAVKKAPNLAFGFNGGVQGLVSLTNRLHNMLKSLDGKVASIEDIDIVFQEYQSQYRPLASTFLVASGQLIRLTTWQTWKDWLHDRYISGAMNTDWKIYHQKFGPLISQAVVLSFLDEENLPPGKIPWAHFPDSTVAKPKLSFGDKELA